MTDELDDVLVEDTTPKSVKAYQEFRIRVWPNNHANAIPQKGKSRRMSKADLRAAADLFLDIANATS